MSDTTPVPEKKVNPGPSYELDFDARLRKASVDGKTLTELFSVDVVFFVCVLACGLIFDSFPVATVVSHLVLSGACAAACLFVSRSRLNDLILTAFIVFSCTVTGLLDCLFVVQTACLYSGGPDEETRPSRLGVPVDDDETVLFVLVSAHVTSAGAAVYRACVAHARMGVDANAALVGAAPAATMLYAAWIVDAGRESFFRAHFLIFILFLAVTVLDAALELGRVRFSKTHAWWILSVTLFAVYIFLVVNVTRVFEDFSLGGFGDDLMTHPYESLCGKLQCVGVLGVVVGLLAARVARTCPKNDLSRLKEHNIRTPAALSDVEPFASVCVALSRQGLVVLPLVCSVVALFGDATPAVSRFVLLLYGSSLSLRFWIQSATLQTWLFVTTASLGLLLDAVVGLDIGLGDREVLLRERGGFETYAITFVATASACIGVVCLAHPVSQRVRLEISEGKKMK